MNRDIEPLDRIATQVSPATIFGPQGNCVEGADEVNATNTSSAKFFESGSKSSFEIMQMAANNGIAFWAGIQRSTVQMRGEKDSISMDLRVTEAFRLEDGEWKLVHRHADPLTSESDEVKK